MWGLEHFRFYIYGKPVKLFSDHSALEPLLRRNRANKIYSARLTRWLDRISHFDVSVNHIAGEEIKLTDYLSRHPTGEARDGSQLRRRVRHQFISTIISIERKINGITETSESEAAIKQINICKSKTHRHNN